MYYVRNHKCITGVSWADRTHCIIKKSQPCLMIVFAVCEFILGFKEAILYCKYKHKTI